MTTVEQLTLAGFVTPDVAPTASIQERFEAFHTANPWILAHLERLTQDWLRQTGGRRLGMKALFERLRWEHGIHTGGDPWRLNNVFTSRYARLLIELHPEWTDVFETRSLKAA